MKKAIKRRRINIKVFLSRVFSLLLSVALIFVLTSSVIAKSTNPEFKEITVKRGDTLWVIVKSNYGEDVNIEKAIYSIKKVNNMAKSDIYPGKKLKIPLNM